MKKITELFVVAAALMFLAGCSGDQVKLEPVTGTLLVDGEKVSNVLVVFSPATGEGMGSFGVTDASGKYELIYRDERKGVPAGTFKITYSKLTMPDGSPIPDGVDTPSEVSATKMIPAQPSNVDNITETVTVPKGGDTFDLSINL